VKRGGTLENFVRFENHLLDSVKLRAGPFVRGDHPEIKGQRVYHSERLPKVVNKILHALGVAARTVIAIQTITRQRMHP
jgi:hypothetical protein